MKIPYRENKIKGDDKMRTPYKECKIEGDDKMKIPYNERCEIVAMLYKYDFNNNHVEQWIDDFKKACDNFKVKETDVLGYLILC